MEIQGTQKTQSNFEKQQSWRTYTSQFQNCPKLQLLRQCGWYRHKRSMESVQSPEINLYIYTITNFQKGRQDNSIKKGLSNNWYWKNWVSTCKRMRLALPTLHYM